VKFLVDMPLSPSLAHKLVAGGHDAVHASALGLDRAADAEILTRALQDARTVRIATGYSAAEKTSLFAGTATKFYRLG
jgi:predicted nuclease of predicted toxin-antitoxin system